MAPAAAAPGTPALARSVSARSRRPGWLVAVWIATALYLLVELSFNARLLDVVGGDASPAEIDRIEIWGRLISGFALALLGWPTWIRKAWSRHYGSLKRVGYVLAWSLLAMATMYIVQEAFLRWLVSRSDPAERERAQHLILLRNGLHQGLVSIPGLDAGPRELSAPEGKAFVAMFPMLASGLGEAVDASFGVDKRKHVSRQLVLKAMGDPNAHYEGYHKLIHELHGGYVQYEDALRRIRQEGEQAWSKYVQRLRRNGYSPSSVPARGHARVRRDVQRNGVPVAYDWKPGDRTGFIEAATRSGRQKASSEFSLQLASSAPAFQGVHPPDTFAGFMNDESMQRRILSTIGYGCLQRFNPDIVQPQHFVDKLYGPEADCLAQRMMDASRDEDAGTDAMRALLVPIIALALSLLGALAHIGKFSLLSTKLVLGRNPRGAGWVVAGLMTAPFAILLLLAWIPLADITRQKLYCDLESELAYPVALVMRGTIHGQHVGYPLFNAVRTHAMNGFDFGYRNHDQQPPEPAGGNGTGRD